MENITKSKEEYIKKWNEEIDIFNILAFCKNEVYHKAVKKCQKDLRYLVKQIADTKNLN